MINEPRPDSSSPRGVFVTQPYAPDQSFYNVVDRLTLLLEQAFQREGMSYPEAQRSASHLLDEYDRQMRVEIAKRPGM